MNYNKIDTNILPKAWLHWTTTKGSFYVNCETNAKENYPPVGIEFKWSNQNEVLFNAGSKPLWAYAKYHEDIDRLEIAGATFDTRRTADSHKWKYAGKRYFIDRDKNIFDEEGRPVDSRYTLDERNYAYNFKNFMQMYHRQPAKREVVDGGR